MKLQCAVEGDGDVRALPALLRNIAPTAQVLEPWRVDANKIFKGNWNQIEAAAQKARANAAGLLVLLDTECEELRCPKRCAPEMQRKLEELAPDVKAVLVLAECKFETWFLEVADRFPGTCGLRRSAPPTDPPAIRGAKKWLSDHMPTPYRETIHQAKFAKDMDWQAARGRNRSFRKFCEAVEYLTEP